jgi:hypothetical protein
MPRSARVDDMRHFSRESDDVNQGGVLCCRLALLTPELTTCPYERTVQGPPP